MTDDNNDTTPAIDGTAANLDIGAIEDNDREKRGVDGLLDKVNGMSFKTTSAIKIFAGLVLESFREELNRSNIYEMPARLYKCVI